MDGNLTRRRFYVNCGYQRGCAWNVYVKDGIVWREEHVGDYLIPCPLNPVQLAGGYCHLQPMVMMQKPGWNDRGTRVDLERIDTSH
jgi:nitrate reductase alpha subunit